MPTGATLAATGSGTARAGERQAQSVPVPRSETSRGQAGCLAFGLLVLVVGVMPLEYVAVWAAWDVHYEDVARSQGLVTESDFRSDIDRAAWRTVVVLMVVQIVTLLWLWRRMSRPSDSSHDADAAT